MIVNTLFIVLNFFLIYLMGYITAFTLVYMPDMSAVNPAQYVAEIPVPELLRTIPQPPAQLFAAGADLQKILALPRVAIVGSRSISPYGKQVTMELAYKLAASGVVIVSGLALGVDAAAHRATIEAGGITIAVLPSSIERIAPSNHHQLAGTIISSGGALLTEYPAGSVPFKQNFIARNRLMAGLADVVLITEAAEKSGSLHTARFALEQGKDVLAIPGNITNRGSIGTNNLIKAGARLVTSHVDVLQALGLERTQAISQRLRGRNAHEQTVLDLLYDGTNDAEALRVASNLSVPEFNQVLTMLEISGKVRPLGLNRWAPQQGTVW